MTGSNVNNKILYIISVKYAILNIIILLINCTTAKANDVCDTSRISSPCINLDEDSSWDAYYPTEIKQEVIYSMQVLSQRDGYAAGFSQSDSFGGIPDSPHLRKSLNNIQAFSILNSMYITSFL